MALKNEYEVIIVGYGPLGQLCGLILSKLGVKIAIIERKKLDVENNMKMWTLRGWELYEEKPAKNKASKKKKSK